MFGRDSSWSGSAARKARAVRRTTACRSFEEATYFAGRDWVRSSVVARVVEEPAIHLAGWYLIRLAGFSEGGRKDVGP
jgi:hypothetical protein